MDARSPLTNINAVLVHPFFKEILLHSDHELATAVGAEIVDRQTIHEWPLACVQRLLLADGRTLAYKSQRPPTVEARFYSSASSTLLPGHRVLGRLGDCDVMTIDWIDAPLLRDVARDERELVDHGRRVTDQIGEIFGELPTYLNIGTADAWLSVADAALEKFDVLIRRRRFVLTNLPAVERIRNWTSSADVIETIAAHARVIHGDLTNEQVFVTADGYRVIDWQRPVVAPPEVDLVALLVGSVSSRASTRIDPRRHVKRAVVGIFWFLRLHWAVKAQFDLFPDFRGPLFDQWSSEAVQNILD